MGSVTEQELRRWFFDVFSQVPDDTYDIAAQLSVPKTITPEARRRQFRTSLATAGLLDQYVAILTLLQEHWGADIRVPIVNRPPYVVVASTGPVLRLTLPQRRAVITIACFCPTNPEYHLRAGPDVRVKLT